MSNRRAFEIAFVGLKPGIHEYHYDINDKFFEEYTQQDFKSVKAQVRLTLDKKSGFMILKFEIGGTLEVTCDRCGNDLPLNLWDEFNMVIKMVESPDEMNDQETDPDVYYISRTESHIDVKNWMYEFINLSVPMQRMCPDNEAGESTCNQDVLAKLANMEPQQDEETPKEVKNSLWKGLDKFKNQ